MGIFDFLKKKKKSNDFEDEGVDEELFYEVTESNVVLYDKSGKEIARGFICFSIMEVGGGMRQEEDCWMVDNGKHIDEYDPDTVEWGEERILQKYDNYDDALKYLEEITS